MALQHKSKGGKSQDHAAKGLWDNMTCDMAGRTIAIEHLLHSTWWMDQRGSR